MSDFDRIEEHREFVAGLEYEDWRERVYADDDDLPLRFKRIVTAHGCQLHDDPLDCELPVQAAHLIPKQALRRRGFSDDVVYDPRNGIGACYRAHRRSDAGLERFPAERIPEAAWEFAEELNLVWMLERLYGERVAA